MTDSDRDEMLREMAAKIEDLHLAFTGDDLRPGILKTFSTCQENCKISREKSSSRITALELKVYGISAVLAGVGWLTWKS